MARVIKSIEQIHKERGFKEESQILQVATVAGTLLGEIQFIDYLLNLEDVSDSFRVEEIKKVVNKYMTEE